MVSIGGYAIAQNYAERDSAGSRDAVVREPTVFVAARRSI